MIFVKLCAIVMVLIFASICVYDFIFDGIVTTAMEVIRLGSILCLVILLAIIHCDEEYYF